ncbi:cytochrome P450 [Streptomyces sp. NPDC001380]|uniref:cytochrome P450 n=1 Tax=Streptomyces sp. NPDC001380 TaxID=3364566 RepID=UPI0036C4F801
MSEVPEYPFEREGVLTPCPHYARLRAESPVALVRMPSGDTARLVTSHEGVRAVLGDPRFSREATLAEGAPRLAAAPQRFPSLPNLDGAPHARVRALVSREFTARRVAALRPRIQELTDGLLDRLADGGPGQDLVGAFAFPLPVRVICELLGVPLADQEMFSRWSAAFVATTGSSAAEMLAAQAGLRGYLVRLLDAKRASPGDDLLSALVSVHEQDQEQLSQEELVYLGVSLLVAGHETTVNQIANGTLALLLEPRPSSAVEALAEGSEDEAAAVVEELLRLHLPGDETLLRIAVEDVAVEGTVVRAGEAVLPSLGSANRDAARFAEPDALRWDRPERGHLSFGHGPHYCLGSGLARAELQIALRSLFRRFPTLRLDVPPAQVPRSSGRLIHGVSRLQVAW